MSMHADAAMSIWTRMPGQTWPGFAGSFLIMWMTMTVRMMLPPFGVALWLRRRTAVITPPSVSTVWAALGYFGVWSAAGVVFLLVVGVVSALSVGTQPRLVIGVAACAVQLTHWAKRLIVSCADLPAVKGVPRDGGLGAPWRYGVCLGLHCARNCAPLMTIALAFAGMDSRAMAATTLLMTAERLADRNVSVRDGGQ